MSTIRVNTLQSLDGTYTYGRCLAWVLFNGTGTVAIQAALNVSTITDNGTGDYTINFTNAFADGNYAISVNSGSNTLAGVGRQGVHSTTNCGIQVLNASQSGFIDHPVINFVAFG